MSRHPPTMSKPLRQAAAQTLVASAVLGLASAFGDWVWARFLTDGAVLPGVVHGVLLFLLVAVVLGWAAGSGRALARLVLALPAAGLALAAAFYPLASLLGYLGALLATWVGMWLVLALLQRWARGARETAATALARGLLAAVASGLAFWLVSGMWTNPGLELSYPLRFAAWTLAFLPGFASLLLPAGRGSASAPAPGGPAAAGG